MPNASDIKRRRGTIQSVDRAARILQALGAGPRRLGVSQLADQLGLSRPTVHGLLQTLAAHGFVEQDRDSDKYQLGAGLLHLGNSYLDLNELRARSLVHAEPLPKLTQRTLSARALQAELKGVREQGYAREREEAVLGESSIAAPIHDHAGHAVGAIGVVGDTADILPRAPARGLPGAVTEAARAISRELGAG